MLTGIVSTVLVLGGLIFFHELGHFLTARLCGVGVRTFSIGFGPALCAWKGKATTYKIGAFPLGGYVSMVGEADSADIPAPFTVRDSFFHHPARHRLAIVAAGPLFNLLLAWLIFWGLGWGGQLAAMAEIDQVLAGSPAEKAGLVHGDVIVEVNGQETPTWGKMYALIQQYGAEPLEILAERGERLLRFSLRAEKFLQSGEDGEKTELWRIGISASGRGRALGFAASARRGLEETWKSIALIGGFLARLFAGEGSARDVGGPIMIAQMVSQQAQRGVGDVFFLAAFLSVNLGLLNLLPIPALDGGAILFCLAEIVARRPVPLKVQSICIYAGFSALIALMVAATVFDVFRLVQ